MMSLGIGRRRRTRSRSREVSCPFCGRDLEVAKEAVSFPCSRCNRRVELEDLEVFENISRDLMTGGSVLVRPEATVHGNIHASVITIMGVVHGNLVASVKIGLTRGARIVGDIVAPTIDMRDGAKITGSLKIKPKPKPRPEGKRQSVS